MSQTIIDCLQLDTVTFWTKPVFSGWHYGTVPGAQRLLRPVYSDTTQLNSTQVLKARL